MVLNVAVAQAITGAKTIQEMVKEFRHTVIEIKAAEGNTPVTEIDRESARRMTQVAVDSLRGDVCVIDEELGFQGDANALWQCYQDSCDGTTNFFFDPDRVLPVAGATYVRQGRTEHCAVADPVLRRVVYASRSGGVWVRDFDDDAAPQKVTLPALPPVPKRVLLFDALLNAHTRSAAGQMITACGMHTQNLRTYGSCLLHLWLLATGKAHVVLIDAVSGFWDLGMHLACQEVGCRVTDVLGNEIAGPSAKRYGEIPLVLATAPGIPHDEMLAAAQDGFGKGYTGFRGPHQ